MGKEYKRRLFKKSDLDDLMYLGGMSFTFGGLIATVITANWVIAVVCLPLGAVCWHYYGRWAKPDDTGA